MKRKQWLDTVSKEELAFRMYQKYVMQQNCLECVFYKADDFGHYKCAAEEWIQLNCEQQFEEWMEEDME